AVFARREIRKPLILFTMLLLLAASGAVVPARAAAPADPGVSLPGLDEVGYIAAAREEQFYKGVKAHNKQEYTLARRLWSPLARVGDAEAQFFLGLIYDNGHEVARDAAVAASWYRRAARAGHQQAQHNLAVAYAEGDGVAPNPRRAIALWRQAARQGSVDAQYNLGVVYALGKYGVGQDLRKAQWWWRMAAISGDVMAQYNLGTLYANGEGVTRSYCEAVRWWEKSAKRGYQQAHQALTILTARADYRACW
ncbi:MAG: sel1 repeat family protein, partial [Pseudomonadota bacterium]